MKEFNNNLLLIISRIRSNRTTQIHRWSMPITKFWCPQAQKRESTQINPHRTPWASKAIKSLWTFLWEVHLSKKEIPLLFLQRKNTFLVKLRLETCSRRYSPPIFKTQWQTKQSLPPLPLIHSVLNRSIRWIKSALWSCRGRVSLRIEL